MNNFNDLVKKAFIEPLRSVLIVDDEYPTWEEILNANMGDESKDRQLDIRSNAKSWRSNPSAPLKVIKNFRERNPGFVIDIHDALATNDLANAETQNETVAALASHLHQSDLLVLDYNLEGASTGLRGKKAREIINSVLSNQHFNLIIVHTGEENLQEVAEDSLISLLSSCTSKFCKKELADIAALDEKLTELEDDEQFDRKQLIEFFAKSQYLHVRSIGLSKSLGCYMSGERPLSALFELATSLKLSGKDKRVFLYWSIFEFEKSIENELSSEEIWGMIWKISAENNWIRTSKGFVCFIKKGPENLLEELEKALIDWRPTPSRLLSAKYRYELNRIGVEAEDGIFLKHHTFAMFYKNISNTLWQDMPFEQKEIIQEFRLREHVSRQSEGMSFLIENKIVEFGKRIVEIDKEHEYNFLDYYDVDFSNDQESKNAIAQYNSYVSTLPNREGPEQLDSGHIFKINEQWWVCATPACDLQPGQNTIAFGGKSKNLRPFMAFPLVSENPDNLESRHINGGTYCFVEDNGKIVALGIKSIGDERKPSDLKVHWQNFVAENGGLITNRKLVIRQFFMTDDDISVVSKEATVVCKLRYAYALNYIQRVGISTSRIGLEYVS
ncbi:response regulator receiver domain [Shewanella algae]|uniref:response regulator receiver domain n=1 Tax=Shewanella algae TaxID=38313 RepID=UPI00313C2FFD